MTNMYYQLSNPQKRVWYVQKMNTESPIYNLGGYLKITGKIQFFYLEQAIQSLIRRHEGMRLRFTEENGEVYQYVENSIEHSIELIDFTQYDEPKTAFMDWSNQEFKKPFEIEHSALYYFALYKVDENEGGFFLKIHHLISDGWSINIIQRQICDLYENLVHKTEMTDLNYSYIDYLEKERKYEASNRFIKNKNYWCEKFKNITPDILYKSSIDVKGKRKMCKLDFNLSKMIKEFCRENAISLNIFFIALVTIYIFKTTGKGEIILGNPVYNRGDKRDKNTIGMYTSTMPVRFEINPEESWEQLIQQVISELKGSLYNQKYPYDYLVKDIELMKTGYDSLFNVSINYYNTEFVKSVDNMPVEVKEYYNGYQDYALQIVIHEWVNECIALQFDYKVSEYTEEEMMYMYKYITNMANQILDDTALKIKNIHLYDLLEYEEKIYEFNSNKSSCNEFINILDLIDIQSEKAMYQQALLYKDKIISYSEMNKWATKLAWTLKDKGIARNSHVAIIGTHSDTLIEAMLAVLKTGATYIPIDPSYPIERIRFILKDANVSMILTNTDVSEALGFNGALLDLREEAIYSLKEEKLRVNIEGNDVAYIIYTSGSTGKPKGVQIQHKNLINYIIWANKMYLKDEDDVFAFYSSISFDLTITSIFAPLISGHAIAIYEDDGNEFVLEQILRENRATVIKLTPSHLLLLKDRDNKESHIRRFIVGGEAFKVTLAREIEDSFGGKIEQFNEYGPTEATVGCMIHKFNSMEDTGLNVPVGKPADNVQIYILDDKLELSATGTIGEIYISGEGLALGYLNRHKLTKEKFIKNPFIEGAFMYQTGDLAKYLSSGIIDCIGRRDNQVKIRGHRIELGEIESIVLSYKGIKKAVVVQREIIKLNEILCAYLIVTEEIDFADLKKWMLERIPIYMIPNYFMTIDRIPLTINGKVDVELLPIPIIDNKSDIECKEGIEKKFIEIVQEVVGINHVSLENNFYQIGGDSIKAIQISSKLKEEGYKVNIKNILSSNTIEEILATLESEDKMKRASQEIIEGEILKTPIIKWFFSHKLKQSYHYNQSLLLEYGATIKVDRLNQVIKKLLVHHDILRLNYNSKKDTLYYNNLHLNQSEYATYIDLSKVPMENAYQEIDRIATIEKASFNLESSLLFKVCIFRLQDGKNFILLTAHHLVVDGVSWRIILEDFLFLLEHNIGSSESELPLKTNSYKEWAEALERYSKNSFIEEIPYWNMLQDKDFQFETGLICDNNCLNSSKSVEMELEQIFTEQMNQKFSEIYGITFNEVLLIGLAIVLHRKSGSNDIVFEVEGHGREGMGEEIDISRTVGWFTNIYPICLKVETDIIDNTIKSLKEQLRNIPNKGFNFGIIKYLKDNITNSHKKMIRFNYLGDFDNILKYKDLDVSTRKCGADIGEENSSTSLLDINCMILNKKLSVNIIYSQNQYRDKMIQDFGYSYIEVLKELINHCNGKKDIEFTSSDFDTADISQDDLAELFD